jgi:hypothetical protein
MRTAIKARKNLTALWITEIERAFTAMMLALRIENLPVS